MINYSVIMSDSECINVEDHCFGGLTDFYEYLSDEYGLRGYDRDDFMSNIERIAYQLESLESEEVNEIISSISWIKNCRAELGEVYFEIDTNETWDELILKMTFIRNLDSYNHQTYNELLVGGFSTKVSAIVAQLAEDTHDKFHPYKDGEYAWLCPLSVGDKALENLIRDTKPLLYNQDKLDECDGYLRDNRLADLGKVFNKESEPSDGWNRDGTVNNHFMKLCRTHCIVGDAPAPFFNKNSVGDNGTLIIGEGTNKRVFFNRLTNWLQLKGL